MEDFGKGKKGIVAGLASLRAAVYLRKLFSSRRNILIALFAMAFLIRLAYLLDIEGGPFFYYLTPGSDMQTYDRVAREVLSGDVDEGDTDLSPLYPYFYLPLNYLLFDVNSADQYYIFFTLAIQCMLGALTALIIFLIAEKMFGRTAGILAGLIAAVYSVFIIYDATLLSECLLNFLCALMFWLWLRAEEDPTAKNRIAAAIALGLTIVSKPSAMVFLPALFIWQYLNWKKKLREHGEENVPRKKVLFKRYAMTIGVILAVTFPFVLKNYFLTGHFSLLRQSGYLFLMGNNPTATGMHDYPAGKTLEEYRERTKGLSKPDANREGFYMALEYIVNNPGDYAALTWKKTQLFWGALEIPNNLSVEYYRRTTFLSWPIFIGFGVLFPLAFMGFLFSLRQWRQNLFLYLCIIFYSISIIAYLVIGRYRLAIVPFMIPLAAYGICNFFAAFRSAKKEAGFIKRWKNGVLLALALVVFITVYNGKVFYRSVFPVISPRGNYIETSEYVVVRDDNDGFDYYATMLDSEDDALRKELFVDREPMYFQKASIALRATYQNKPEIEITVNGRAQRFRFNKNFDEEDEKFGRWEFIPVDLKYLQKGYNLIEIRLVVPEKTEGDKKASSPWIKIFIDETYDFDRSACSINGRAWRYDTLDIDTYKSSLTHHIPRGEYFIRLVLR